MAGDDRTMRLFFAIAPDGAARARLDALARHAALATEGRASDVTTLHLTLVFVGTVADALVGAVSAAGGEVAWPRSELVLDRTGSFARAGVAWAAPSIVDPALMSAQRSLVERLAARGVPTEARPWQPHVTLARRCARVIEGRIHPPIAWRADRVVLMASRLRPEDPRHSEIAAWTTA